MRYDELNRMTQWRQTGGGRPKVERHIYRGAEWHRAGLVTREGGHRTAKAFLYDGDNVVADLTPSGGTLGIDRCYVTPFLDQNLSMTVEQGPQAGTYYYSQDGLGSVRTLTDAAGAVKNTYDYTAFGEPYQPNTVKTVENRYTYTGREASSVGAPMYYRYRMYDTVVGSFTRRDPLFEIIRHQEILSDKLNEVLSQVIRYETEDVRSPKHPLSHNGPGLYKAYFVPYAVDPYGLAICFCSGSFTVLDVGIDCGKDNVNQTVGPMIQAGTGTCYNDIPFIDRLFCCDHECHWASTYQCQRLKGKPMNSGFRPVVYKWVVINTVSIGCP